MMKGQKLPKEVSARLRQAIWQMKDRGMKNVEIAKECGVTPPTVTWHLKSKPFQTTKLEIEERDMLRKITGVKDPVIITDFNVEKQHKTIAPFRTGETDISDDIIRNNIKPLVRGKDKIKRIRPSYKKMFESVSGDTKNVVELTKLVTEAHDRVRAEYAKEIARLHNRTFIQRLFNL